MPDPRLDQVIELVAEGLERSLLYVQAAAFDLGAAERADTLGATQDVVCPGPDFSWSAVVECPRHGRIIPDHLVDHLVAAPAPVPDKPPAPAATSMSAESDPDSTQDPQQDAEKSTTSTPEPVHEFWRGFGACARYLRVLPREDFVGWVAEGDPDLAAKVEALPGVRDLITADLAPTLTQRREVRIPPAPFGSLPVGDPTPTADPEGEDR